MDELRSDHERNCAHQCAPTRRILTRRPRTEASQFQAVFLLVIQSGRNCLESLLFCASPPLSALNQVAQIRIRRLLANAEPWLAGRHGVTDKLTSTFHALSCTSF